MEKLNNLEKEWVRSLRNNEPGELLTTIFQIRNSGSVRMIPHLVALLKPGTDPEARKEIFSLLTELKDQQAVPYLMEAMNGTDFGEFLPHLVSACWQSGLDFSAYLPRFVTLFVHSDYMTALEAFTVIEESILHAGEADRINCINQLRDSENVVSDEKLPLYYELCKVLEEF